MDNYKLVLHVLKKWPVDKSKGSRCFGNHLRELARKSFPKGELFPGNEADNRKMLQSLMRISNNTYGEIYSYRKGSGASGYDLKFIHQVLSEEFASRGFTKIGS